MLRIATLIRADRETVLELQGRLAGPWVELLARECQRHGPGAGPLELDLEQVEYVDRPGRQLLQELERAGVTLKGLAPMIRDSLEEET
jgi:ABC-type transporter Mla MlaB component